MAILTGRSYLSMSRSDRTRPEYSTYTPPMELLPAAIAPVDKQCRVFLNDTELTYDDPTLLFRPDTNKWSHLPASAAAGGVACWGVRFIFDPIGTADCKINTIAIWDDDDNLIVMNEDWSIENEIGDTDDTDGFEVEVLDGLYNTNQEFAGDGTQKVTVRFPTKKAVSKFGFSSFFIGGSAEMVQNMEVQVNIGSISDPDWFSIGSNLTQDLGNSADNHMAGEAITPDDYPPMTIPQDPDTQLLTLSVLPQDMGGEIPPTVIVDPEPSLSSDRVLIIRDTRQDKPWVRPTNVSRPHPEQIMIYFDQIRFIAQDLCEYSEIQTLFSLGWSEANPNDYSRGNQSQFHAGGGTTLSYADVELLDTIPGAPIDDRHQLLVQYGNENDGTSNQWTTATYSATPVDEFQYSVDSNGDTITFGDPQTQDVRIRRSTRTDKWWYDPRGGVPGWNSLGINAMQRQARYMLEEACYLPQWYEDSPLSSGIFPRGWNWFIFVGTRDQWNIPGPVWGGDGQVIIYKNDLLLTEGVDYELSWPGIVWLGPPPGDDDTTVVGIGGGFGSVGLGGGDDSESNPRNVASSGGVPTPPIQWPGVAIDPDCGFSLSIGDQSRSSLQAGEWEGETPISFSQGNATSSNFGGSEAGALRYELVVTKADRIGDGLGGYLPVGATEVLYVNKKCSGTMYRLCIATSLTGSAPWTSSVASGLLGCLSPAGATGGLNIFGNRPASCLVSSQSPPNLRHYDAMNNTSIEDNLGSFVPFHGQWLSLSQQSRDAEGAGVVGDDGFTGDQWDRYIDPNQDFNDFDIPPIP